MNMTAKQLKVFWVTALSALQHSKGDIKRITGVKERTQQVYTPRDKRKSPSYTEIRSLQIQALSVAKYFKDLGKELSEAVVDKELFYPVESHIDKLVHGSVWDVYFPLVEHQPSAVERFVLLQDNRTGRWSAWDYFEQERSLKPAQNFPQFAFGGFHARHVENLFEKEDDEETSEEESSSEESTEKGFT